VQAGTETPEITVDGDGFRFTLQPQLGVLSGESKEAVYDDSMGGNLKISELDWELKNIVVGGGTVALAFWKVQLNAGYWTSLTQGDGQMEDWDWLLYREGSPWTDYSLSDTDADADLIDVNLTADLLTVESVLVQGIIGYKQNQFSFQDYGIRHIYSTSPEGGGFRDEVADDDGSTGILYDQTFSIPYIGGAVTARGKKLAVRGYVTYSPMVKARDVDEHLFRALHFEEEFEGGDFFGAGLSSTYAFTANSFMRLAYERQVVSEIIGDSTVVEQGRVYFFEDAAGIGNEFSTVSVSVGHVF
jgi:outer membrane protease